MSSKFTSLRSAGNVRRPGLDGHRPDIDGLRAMAIIPVVAYHAGVPYFSGGYIGVDVFFVISGFLITGLLLKEADAVGAIDVLGFYARRMRRLAPAFGVVTAVSLLIAVFALSPFGERQEMAKSAIAASAYVSNFFFWANSGGYFGGPVDTMPLLHTWSLAVEEQFYAIWPALVVLGIWIARRSGLQVRSTLLAFIIALICVSFGASVYLTRVESDAAFYLMPSRTWQLALGGLLAVTGPTLAALPPVVRNLSGVTGLVLIVASVATLTDKTPYPGLAALVPTLGAALCIAGGMRSGSGAVARVLTLKPLQFCGLVSYSWYLWHWPMLAFARSMEMGPIPQYVAVPVVGLAFLLAVVTYLWIETPIRTKRPWPFSEARQTVAAGLGISAALVLLALLVGLGARMEARQERYEPLANVVRQHEYHVRCLEPYPFDGILARRSDCSTGRIGSGQRILLWGDSHANHLMPTMAAVGRHLGFEVIERAMSGCPPVPDIEPAFERATAIGCAKFNSMVRQEVAELARVGPLIVVLSGRWSRYLLADPVARQDVGRRFSIDRTVDTQDVAIRKLESGLAETLDYIQIQGAPVLLVAPTPELEIPAAECLYRRSATDCAVPRSRVDSYRLPAMAVLSRLADQRPSVDIWDPAAVLCDDRECRSVIDNTVMYWDNDHLTVGGAMSLIGSAENAVRIVMQKLPADPTSRHSIPSR